MYIDRHFFFQGLFYIISIDISSVIQWKKDLKELSSPFIFFRLQSVLQCNVVSIYCYFYKFSDKQSRSYSEDRAEEIRCVFDDI